MYERDSLFSHFFRNIITFIRNGSASKPEKLIMLYEIATVLTLLQLFMTNGQKKGLTSVFKNPNFGMFVVVKFDVK